MSITGLYRDIAARTYGNIYIGVVGPVRSGKSTFIKRFMEKLVIPAINDPFVRERTRDELPQSGSGRTIMTAEPKFIPEEAINIEAEEGVKWSVRLVDCVGYMVKGASGNIEAGSERMVMTPWYEEEMPISRAAEEGTRRVITEHSTIGIVISTDGSICDIPRSDYIQPEERVIDEMRKSGKPFVMILNCAEPESEESQKLAHELSIKYSCECICLSCLELDEEMICELLSKCLKFFPVERYNVFIPEWIEALCDENSLKTSLYSSVYEACATAENMDGKDNIIDRLNCCENISTATIKSLDMGEGSIEINISMPRKLYYDTLSTQSGYDIKNDKDLISILTSMKNLKGEYERIHDALMDANETGYGIVMPGPEEMKLEEPQVVKQGGRYGVKLKASAPSIHLIKTNVETEVSPAIGGERASEDMINFLIQGFDGDMSRIWESNIFGKSLNDIAGEGLAGKIKAVPNDTKSKLKGTIERIVNEGSGGLICIIL